MLLLVLRHLTCASCVAWMCCTMPNSMKHEWPSPDLSSQRGHRFSLANMLFSVLRHPTWASYIAWMCCRMSDSIKHFWARPDLSFDRLWLYTFLHSLRSYFSPSRSLQLCFEAACEKSFARDIYAMQSTQKSVEGATALLNCPSRRRHVVMHICVSSYKCRCPCHARFRGRSMRWGSSMISWYDNMP